MRRMSFNNLFLTSMSVFLLITQPNIYAQVDTFEFDNDEQQGRFRQLSNELRCPMCQNTNLSGSTGGVAEDLRREIHRMILEGMSNEEIEQFMFERYGDFIFYRPRLRAETILLVRTTLIFDYWWLYSLWYISTSELQLIEQLSISMKNKKLS